MNPLSIHSPIDLEPYFSVPFIFRLLLWAVALPAIMASTTSCQVLTSSGISTYPSPMCLGVWASLPADIGFPILFARASDLTFADGMDLPFLASIPSNG